MIQSDIFFDVEGLDTLATIPSKQEEDSFEGYFSGSEHSFKKKPNLGSNDTEVLDPTLLYAPPRAILPEVKRSLSLDEKEASSLEVIYHEETKSFGCSSSLAMKASLYESPGGHIQGLGLMPKMSDTHEIALAPEASSLNENAQHDLKAFGKVGAHIKNSASLPLSKGLSKEVEQYPLGCIQTEGPKEFLEPSFSAFQEKRISPSVFSNNKDFETNPDKHMPETARVFSKQAEDALAMPPSLEKNSKEEVLKGPLKPVLSSPLVYTSSSSYTEKDKFARLPNPAEGQSSAFLKSVSTSFSPYHRSGQSIALGASLKPSPASSLVLKELGHADSEAKDAEASSKTLSLNELEYPWPVSFTQPPLDIHEARAIVHHEKIQTDLVGLIADYFDKMREEGRSWTRLSLHLGQDKKMQLLLRIQGNALGLRFQEAPSDMSALLLKEWPHLSRIASQKGFRLQNPSFLGSPSSERVSTATL